MTEHAAVIFVFFFLAEYASIILICILTSILFLGGYILDFRFLFYILQYNNIDFYFDIIGNTDKNNFLHNPLIEGIIYGIILGLKTCIMVFIFI
jgi:NADH-ubiquinone oxidoreductase chain 1